MPVSDDSHPFVLEQLGQIRPVASKRMIGGAGLSSGGVSFGVVDDNRIFVRSGPGSLADRVALESVALGSVAKIRVWPPRPSKKPSASRRPSPIRGQSEETSPRSLAMFAKTSAMIANTGAM
jgi:hypothetical protein